MLRLSAGPLAGTLRLVTLQFALRSLSLQTGPDALHHGRYGSEGQLLSFVAALVVVHGSGMSVGWFCWFDAPRAVFPRAILGARHDGRYGPE